MGSHCKSIIFDKQPDIPTLLERRNLVAPRPCVIFPECSVKLLAQVVAHILTDQ
jgi:hypothetical protein